MLTRSICRTPGIWIQIGWNAQLLHVLRGRLPKLSVDGTTWLPQLHGAKKQRGVRKIYVDMCKTLVTIWRWKARTCVSWDQAWVFFSAWCLAPASYCTFSKPPWNFWQYKQREVSFWVKWQQENISKQWTNHTEWPPLQVVRWRQLQVPQATQAPLDFPPSELAELPKMIRIGDVYISNRCIHLHINHNMINILHVLPPPLDVIIKHRFCCTCSRPIFGWVSSAQTQTQSFQPFVAQARGIIWTRLETAYYNSSSMWHAYKQLPFQTNSL